MFTTTTLVAAFLGAFVALFVATPDCMKVGRHAARAARGEARGW